jgi:hypothetical protein
VSNGLTTLFRGGPASGANGDNNTPLGAGTFCAPPSALTAAIFGMVWVTSTGARVEQVSLWAWHPPNSTYPPGYPVNLYVGVNASRGGTSFLSLFPAPCSYIWTISVESLTSVQVYVAATLTFNYTAAS